MVSYIGVKMLYMPLPLIIVLNEEIISFAQVALGFQHGGSIVSTCKSF